jgi:hypothetical protein
MANLCLFAETGTPEVDAILRRLVDLLEQQFPKRVRGYYLVGSDAVGCPFWTSDVDVVVLFKGSLDPNQAARFRQTVDEFRGTISYPLDATADGEERLRRAGSSRFYVASLLLYGEDVRPSLPPKPLDAYLRDEMHLPLMLSARVRSGPAALTFPINFPDPSGEFLGYDRRLLRVPGGTPHPCTKDAARSSHAPIRILQQRAR